MFVVSQWQRLQCCWLNAKARPPFRCRQSLARAIGESRPISELVLRQCGLLGSRSATGVASAAQLRKAASLRRLSVDEEENEDTSGAAAFFDELFGGQEGERLQPLSDGPAGATSSLGSGAVALQELRELELIRLSLDAAGLAALGRGLCSRVGAALETLTINSVRLDASIQRRSAIACEVADALLANILTARLRVLTLRWSGTTDEGAGAARVNALLLCRTWGTSRAVC